MNFLNLKFLTPTILSIRRYRCSNFFFESGFLKNTVEVFAILRLFAELGNIALRAESEGIRALEIRVEGMQQ